MTLCSSRHCGHRSDPIETPSEPAPPLEHPSSANLASLVEPGPRPCPPNLAEGPARRGQAGQTRAGTGLRSRGLSLAPRLAPRPSTHLGLRRRYHSQPRPQSPVFMCLLDASVPRRSHLLAASPARHVAPPTAARNGSLLAAHRCRLRRICCHLPTCPGYLLLSDLSSGRTGPPPAAPDSVAPGDPTDVLPKGSIPICTSGATAPTRGLSLQINVSPSPPVLASLDLALSRPNLPRPTLSMASGSEVRGEGCRHPSPRRRALPRRPACVCFDNGPTGQ